MNRIFLNRAAILRFLGALAGTLLFCVGVNLFIVPMNFYNGGIVGIAQILRTLAVSYLHLSLPFDLAGILVYLINIPLFIPGLSLHRSGLFPAHPGLRHLPVPLPLPAAHSRPTPGRRSSHRLPGGRAYQRLWHWAHPSVWQFQRWNGYFGDVFYRQEPAF